MKVSGAFKTAVNNHLQGLAASDPLFAETFKKAGKNIDDCITYILNEVKKTGLNAFADAEIYGMAVHYYDEDDINIGSKSVNAQADVKHKPESNTIVSAGTPVKNADKPAAKTKKEAKTKPESQIYLFG